MTYEEAVNTIEVYKNVAIGNDGTKISNALNVAVDAIIALLKSDKYRWHDLRKDPYDLPPMETDVLVFDGSIYEVCTRIEPYKSDIWFWEDSYGYYIEDNDDVIAWRYIEPFEV